MFAPEIITINELFSGKSELELADSLQLVFKLYHAYKEIKSDAEDFNDFYFWGEMIVNDFDDLDKYLVNHRLLFQNLKDIKDIDEKFGGMDPEIVEIIRRFWLNFDHNSITSEKEDFLAVWDILIELYDKFRGVLRSSGMAYEGMVMRDVIESLQNNETTAENNKSEYHFIGFNALNKCEKELLKHLKNKNIAKFYWDYDNLYITNKDHEAGLFIRENLRLFGQDLSDRLRVDNLIKPEQEDKKFKVYKAPSDVAQAKLIPGLLKEFGDHSSDPHKTAIVLADENLLMPVLNSIPAEVDSINVTMGYPMYQTPVYSLVNFLLNLQKNRRESSGGGLSFYHNDVIRVLGHQYITYNRSDAANKIITIIREENLIRVEQDLLQKDKFFELLFSLPKDYIELNAYMVNVFEEILLSFDASVSEDEEVESDKGFSIQQEYIYHIIRAFKRLDSVFLESGIKLSPEIYSKLSDRMMRKLIVPFSGEPLNGLQVMGILETRALDFENIIIVSVNEGVLPRGAAGSSYIPYNMRMAFGLPTVLHQDSIYAFYFYRLLQRAKRIRFVYNSSSAGMRTGEMSRFLLQLKYSPGFKCGFFDSRFNIVPAPPAGDFIKRTEGIQKFIEEKYLDSGRGRALSPSALNTWISCKLKFYYRYIAGISEQDEVREDVDAPMFGTILHDAMNKLYKPMEGKEISSEYLRKLKDDSSGIRIIIEDSFRNNFMRKKRGEIGGKNLIIISVIENMIHQILKIDSAYAPFTIEGLEKEFSSGFGKNLSIGKSGVRIGGTIDRIDSKNKLFRILDYKSGKDSLEVDTLESLTSYNVQKRNSAAFQTLLYCWIYQNNSSARSLRPSLYPVRSIYDDSFSDIFIIKNGDEKGIIESFDSIADKFSTGLQKVISDILDPNLDFEMTSVEESCTYCPFSKLCDRQDLK